ncbi:hypothetical protein RR46_02519 [Papilio xuthus]|uniref:Uncharacterized protein n=1 Tax=Papilio xuthus TaxID=66420 RepID=A0A194QH34_PAPXU|nr:hypothetical protein RR46_02519 [Papilio xuthus]
MGRAQGIEGPRCDRNERAPSRSIEASAGARERDGTVSCSRNSWASRCRARGTHALFDEVYSRGGARRGTRGERPGRQLRRICRAQVNPTSTLRRRYEPVNLFSKRKHKQTPPASAPRTAP